MTLFYRYLYIFAHVLVFFVFLLTFSLIYQKKSSEELKSPIAIDGILVTPTEIPALQLPTSLERVFYVSPQGSDYRDGFSQNAPLKTIQKAVDLAQAGDSVHLMPGVYLQDVITKRSGTPSRVITITGTKESIIKGGGKARIFEINHDYITLNGFTLDGLHGDAGSSKGYSDKLIYVLGKSARKGVNGLKIISLLLKNAGGECIRLRYFAQQNEIAYNTINRCGVVDFVFNGGGKNGEGIYIGTAPEQLGDGKNPIKDRDESNNNWIHHNTIDTQGNECVDIKEGSSGNIVEYNSCTGQKDAESGGLDSRGNNNIFRYNGISGSVGAGVRLGGDKKSDGIYNDVYENTIRNNAGGGIKFQRRPQGKICGNEMEGNSKGNSVGSYGENFNPTISCS